MQIQTTVKYPLCRKTRSSVPCVSFILTLMTLLTPAAWRSFHTAWFWYTDRAFGSVSQFWHYLPGERVGPMGKGLSPASLPTLRVARGRSRATHDVCLVRQQTGICLNEDFQDESEGLGRCKNRLRHLRQALVSLVSRGCYFFHRSACEHLKTNVYWLFIPYQDLVSKHFARGRVWILAETSDSRGHALLLLSEWARVTSLAPVTLFLESEWPTWYFSRCQILSPDSSHLCSVTAQFTRDSSFVPSLRSSIPIWVFIKTSVYVPSNYPPLIRQYHDTGTIYKKSKNCSLI